MNNIDVASRDSVQSTGPGRLMRTWFGPITTFNVALFRTGLGLLSLIWFATLLPDMAAFFGEASLAPRLDTAPTNFSIYRWVDADRFVSVGVFVGILCSSLLIFGQATRIAGPALSIMLYSTMSANGLLWNSGDDLLQSFSLFFALYCLLTPSQDLDVPLFGSAREVAHLRTGRIWFLQFVRIQMTAIYLIAFLAKIPGHSWRDGTATMTVFRLDTLSRFPTPGIFETSYLLGNVMTWSSLALEGLLPFLLWGRRTRMYAIVAAVAFHIAIDWALAIGLFSWIMILGLTSFLQPDDVSKATAGFRHHWEKYRSALRAFSSTAADA